jgi:hypothetical protein
MPPEPSTVEAFATQWDPKTAQALEVIRGNLAKVNFWAIALLECRMGAQERVLRLLLSSGVNSRWVGENGERIDLCAMAHAALIDAPPVFTLEEVERVVREECPPAECVITPNDLAGNVRKRLAALRK